MYPAKDVLLGVSTISPRKKNPKSGRKFAFSSINDKREKSTYLEN